MTQLVQNWQFWALLAALFAALTAIFGKIGVDGVSADDATWLRRLVVAVALGALVWGTGQIQRLSPLSPRTLVFLGLSGLATGASGQCYFRALKLGTAAQVDKLSVVFGTVLSTLVLGEKMSALGWSGVALIAPGAVLVALG